MHPKMLPKSINKIIVSKRLFKGMLIDFERVFCALLASKIEPKSSKKLPKNKSEKEAEQIKKIDPKRTPSRLGPAECA